MKMDDWMVAPQIFLFNVPSLIPWGFMIQFDLHIFFFQIRVGVGKNHQLEFMLTYSSNAALPIEEFLA